MWELIGKVGGPGMIDMVEYGLKNAPKGLSVGEDGSMRCHGMPWTVVPPLVGG